MALLLLSGVGVASCEPNGPVARGHWLRPHSVPCVAGAIAVLSLARLNGQYQWTVGIDLAL